MVEPASPPKASISSRWPARRRLAWAALFVAMLSWSSLLQPPPPPEVLNWSVTVPA